MIIEHSGNFKVVDPKTKEVRYDSVGSSYYWNNTVASEGSSINYWKEYYGMTSTKDRILGLLKGKTFYDIKNMLEEVFEEVQEKAKY